MKEIYQNLPNKPGIYMFKNEDSQILYVGKAKNLKNRVSSYFNNDHLDRPWIAVMMPLVTDVETIVVDNEMEALMLEATLIKQHLPRFNIKLTDDKAYPYIKFIPNEPIPRFTVTRQQHNDKATYFGPYLSARAALHTLEFLRKLYGIHISNRPLRQRDRACLNCQLNGFTCPLNDEVSEEKYQEKNEQAINFLLGKRKNLANDLESRMHQAAHDHQFELAAKLRDRWQSISQILNRQQVISTTLDDYDVIASACSNSLASVVVLKIREGRVTGQNGFFFTLMGDETEADIIRQFLISMYQNFSLIPKLVVVNKEIADNAAIEQLLSVISGHTVELRRAERGEKRALVELAGKNAAAKLETRLLKTDQSFTALIALKEILKLDNLPYRIEAVDISNLGTSEPVAATVCFINGQPDKNEYRRYKIKTVAGQNDFAMIKEVVTRRFSDMSRPVPDLFVVDGGPQQLRFATAALSSTPLQPKFIISLAKKPDRIFLPERKMPTSAPRGNKGLLLLSRIRDEVHRFGITFQRSRQRKKSLQSEV